MSTHDGGPAFPLTKEASNDYHPHGPIYCGMTLRDWFAGQALMGDLAAQGAETGEWSSEKGPADALATRCYAFADAMLEARKARK